MTQYTDLALRPGRRKLERSILTSSAYTRAQVQKVNEMLRVLDVGREASGAERQIAAMMLASLVGSTLLVCKVLNDHVGLEPFEFDPSEPGFGVITVPDLTGGNLLRLDLFPQAPRLWPEIGFAVELHAPSGVRSTETTSAPGPLPSC